MSLGEVVSMTGEGIHIRRQGPLWLVERGNYLLGEFPSQDQAVKLGRARAKSSHSVLVIHEDNGAVSRSESYKDKDLR